MTVKWSEIETECQGYREGFVNTFRKYQGQTTDEKDAQGRAVKVTATSFARHMGIEEKTFRNWVGRTEGAAPPARSTSQLTSDVRRALKQDTEAVAEAIAELPATERIKLQHKVSKKRLESKTPSPTAKADRKAVEATVNEFVAPIHKALDDLGEGIGEAFSLVETVKEAIEDLRELVTPETMDKQIQETIDYLVILRMEADLS